MKIRAMVTIKGLVQGVAFRHHTTPKAQQHNVSGWVMNLSNGDVQGCFEGEEQDVKALIDWCRRGPSRARVDNVQVEQAPFTGEFDRFTIKY